MDSPFKDTFEEDRQNNIEEKLSKLTKVDKEKRKEELLTLKRKRDEKIGFIITIAIVCFYLIVRVTIFDLPSYFYPEYSKSFITNSAFVLFGFVVILHFIYMLKDIGEYIEFARLNNGFFKFSTFSQYIPDMNFIHRKLGKSLLYCLYVELFFDINLIIDYYLLNL